MSRNMKIVLGIVAAVLLVGCVGMLGVSFLTARMVGQAMDPAAAGDVASAITDFDMPAGYKPLMGINLGMKMAVLGPEGATFGAGTSGLPKDGAMIMLFQPPTGAAVDADAMRAQMAQSMGSQSGLGENMKSAGTVEATIRGQPVTLQVSEGTSRSGDAVKSLSGVFDGKGGPAMLMIIGDAGEWDQDTIDAFLASTR